MELLGTADALANVHAQAMQRAPAEGGAFLGIEESHGRLLLHCLRIFQDGELEPGHRALVLREEAKVSMLAEMKRAGHGVVDVHTHPASDRRVAFSAFDEQELPSYSRYVRLKLRGKPFGAIVLGRRGYYGLFCDDRVFEPLVIRAVGEQHDVPSWLPTAPRDRLTQGDEELYDRQLRALGEDGHARVASTTVGIVGLGGTGSIVVQQLAHLGVRSYVLVDDDVVDLSNLPRLATGTPTDARLARRKDEVAERLIRRQQPGAVVVKTGTLRQRDSLSRLGLVDLIIGCVDNDGARLILSELAAAHLVPYLDLGVSVDRGKDGAIRMGGRTAFYVPGGPCLACADELDFSEAAEDLESEALRRIRIERGYSKDRKVEAALMPINTITAGLAVTEAIAYLTGVRRVVRFQRYDFGESRLVRISAARDDACPVCASSFAMGDRQRLDRYAVQS